VTLNFANAQVWADGRVYDGHWERGVFSGLGTCVWYNGDKYEGEWLDGFAHGLGRYTFVNGDVYEGNIVQDKFQGHGAITHSSGWKYRGGWDAGLMHGYATCNICATGVIDVFLFALSGCLAVRWLKNTSGQKLHAWHGSRFS
jgi:hypothetical protein